MVITRCRGSCTVSNNVTWPQLQDGGTKAVLGVKVLEKAADMLQDVENMSPQTMAWKGRKSKINYHLCPDADQECPKQRND